MEIDEVKEVILSFDTLLSERMKKYIHYRSMRNFCLHFDEIESNVTQEKIRMLLSEYIEEVKANDYDYDGEASLQLARKYLFKISDYYREYSSFVVLMRVKVIILFGLFGDTLLYFTNIPSRILYIPVVTICLLLYFLFIYIFKASKGRVYGIFY